MPDSVPASPFLRLLDDDFAELLLDFAEELLLDFTELLLDTLVSLSLDFGVTLDELLDFAFELLESSQSSQADEESPLGRVAKLPSSSSQATNNAATTPITNNFFKATNHPPSSFFPNFYVLDPARNMSKSR